MGQCDSWEGAPSRLRPWPQISGSGATGSCSSLLRGRGPRINPRSGACLTLSVSKQPLLNEARATARSLIPLSSVKPKSAS